MEQDKPQSTGERRGYSRRLQLPVFWRILLAGGLGAIAAVLLTYIADTRIALVWVCLVVVLLAFRISRPLQIMSAVARVMAAGQSERRIPASVAKRRDETGDVARSFNHMADGLSTAFERQRLLLSNVSHDLKTPLARQRAALERMAGGDSSPVLLSIVQQQNARMEAITQDILAFNQLNEHDSDNGFEAVKLTAVVNQVLGDATEYAELCRVDCHLDVGAGARDLLVLGDRALLRRALEKVLQNALDYSPPGQVVAVRVDHDGSELIFSIADKGPGVAEEALPRLFEPFYREDSARSGDGSGLGLATVHAIMQAHDGRVEAENGSSGGLVVRLCWPVFN